MTAIEFLPDEPSDYLPMQQVTREIAFENGWNAERRARITQLFDEMAPEWASTRGGRQAPLIDALARSGVAPGRVCVEVGSGTGHQTAPLLDRYSHVVSLDLAPGMLGLTARAGSVSLGRADASLLPIRSGSVDAVAVINMFLFPGEYNRVLRPGGSLIFVSTSGEQTPIYLPPEDVVTALEPLFGPATAVASHHGQATWTVVTKVGA
jgi:ubiquinone/menaquinone biosynthesis C-methylase UbiE